MKKILFCNSIQNELEDNDIKSFFKKRDKESNKGTYGYVGIMGGSENYPGAVKLASLGEHALYAGCGVSRIIVPKSIASQIQNFVLEATVFPLNNEYDEEELALSLKGLKALSVGIGFTVTKTNEKIIKYLLKNLDIPLLIDADGLNILSSMDLNILNESKCKIILTPHLKEFSRLIKKPVEEIKENRLELVKEFVSKYNVCLLLKGTTTIIANKDELYLSKTGTPGMATAGSGDVLTGIITGLLGYNTDIVKSVAVGAYINGRAGEYACLEYSEISMVASDTARCVSRVIKDLTK